MFRILYEICRTNWKYRRKYRSISLNAFDRRIDLSAHTDRPGVFHSFFHKICYIKVYILYIYKVFYYIWVYIKNVFDQLFISNSNLLFKLKYIYLCLFKVCKVVRINKHYIISKFWKIVNGTSIVIYWNY